MSVYDPEQFAHVKHVFMSEQDAKEIVEYWRDTEGVKAIALPIQDHYNGWCVLVYDAANHPHHVILLDMGDE